MESKKTAVGETILSSSDLKNPALSSRRTFLAQGAAGVSVALAGGLALAQMPQADIKEDLRSAPGTAEGAILREKLGERSFDLYPGAVDAQGKYVLPPLPYPANALEPHLDAETLQLHHDKHHAGYVKGLIEAEEKMTKLQQSEDMAGLGKIAQDCAFHGAGHYLHCLYWVSMNPKQTKPSAELNKEIQKVFGSTEVLQKQLVAVAKQVQGSGWGVVAWSLPARKLVLLQAHDHQDGTQWGTMPLLVLDVWEHAYYKKYSNKRDDYIQAWFQVINWEGASARYAALRQAMG